MVNFKNFLFILIITQLFQCSINKPYNTFKECNYKIHSIKDVNPNLSKEIEIYLKRLFNRENFQVKDEYLVIWVRREGNNIVYSISYDENIDSHIIDFTNSVFNYENKILIFLNDGNINKLKKFRMSKCEIDTIIKDKFPYYFEYFKEYNMWPIGSNIDEIPVFELIFNNKNILINKKIYNQ